MPPASLVQNFGNYMKLYDRLLATWTRKPSHLGLQFELEASEQCGSVSQVGNP